jgi:hypothetical protein
MDNSAIGKISAAVFAAAICTCPVAAALDFKSSIGAGVDYTDNARLTSKNEEDDWITSGILSASLTETGGPLDANVNTSLAYYDYVNNTYSDQTYFNLGALLGWKQIENRLEWNASDFFSQTPVDNLDPNTPSNLQNTNVFSFGPTINFPVNGRHNFTFSPVFRDFYYEDSDTDNQQYGLSAGWYYQMYPTLNVGLNTSVTKVRYDDDDLNPDFTRSSYQAVLSGTRPRSVYSLKLGMTNIARDRFDDTNGTSGSLDWLFNITDRSSLRTYLSSDISDSSNAYYTSSIDPDTGDYTNVQTSGDVLRNSTGRITYNRDGTVVKARVWTELRDLNYRESSANDRKVMVVGTSLDRLVSPSITAGIYGRYNRTEETGASPSRTDKTYVVGGKMGFSLSRKLSANIDLQYQNRDSEQAVNEYSEFSVFAGINYGFVGF